MRISSNVPAVMPTTVPFCPSSYQPLSSCPRLLIYTHIYTEKIPSMYVYMYMYICTCKLAPLGYLDEPWLSGHQNWGVGREEAPIGSPMPRSPGSSWLMGRQGFGEGVEVDRDGWLLTNSHWQPVNTGQPSRKVRAGMDKGPLDFQSFTLLGASALSAQREKCLWLISGFSSPVSVASLRSASFFTCHKVWNVSQHRPNSNASALCL